MNKNKKKLSITSYRLLTTSKIPPIAPNTQHRYIYGTVLLLEAGSRNSINYQSRTGATFDREVSIRGVRSDKGTLFFHLRAPR